MKRLDHRTVQYTCDEAVIADLFGLRLDHGFDIPASVEFCRHVAADLDMSLDQEFWDHLAT